VGRGSSIVPTPEALPLLDSCKMYFSLLFREELAMKIGLTEARIQVSLMLNNYLKYFFLKRFITQTVYTGCTRINYKIISLMILNKYLHYGTSGTE
jgi:hypothetical protein